MLHIFDPKQLLRVSCILWCYYSVLFNHSWKRQFVVIRYHSFLYSLQLLNSYSFSSYMHFSKPAWKIKNELNAIYRNNCNLILEQIYIYKKSVKYFYCLFVNYSFVNLCWEAPAAKIFSLNWMDILIRIRNRKYLGLCLSIIIPTGRTLKKKNHSQRFELCIKQTQVFFPFLRRITT